VIEHDSIRSVLYRRRLRAEIFWILRVPFRVGTSSKIEIGVTAISSFGGRPKVLSMMRCQSEWW
jgi:hypothetical protein